MSQGVDTSNMSISIEEDQYRDQLVNMNMEDNMTTAKSLNSIAVKAIFSQVLKTDPTQEAPGAHEQMLFKKGYKMFGGSSISVMFKEYKHMEDMEVLSGFNPDSLTS